MAEEDLEVKVGELLRQRGLKLAVAESCTGGLVGHRITNVPGSSDYFLGGIVSYADEAKMGLLGVRAETLTVHGAVSEQTVLEMARGVRRLLEADIGAAVSGIAGPGGGTPEKPVGLVWIGLSTPEGQRAWCHTWGGSRVEVKERSAGAVLQHLADYLRHASKVGGGHARTRSELLEPVDVAARIEQDGRITPLHFTWRGANYPVTSVGRSWQDGTGRHSLVMVPGEHVFELVFQAADGRWSLRPPASKKVA